MRPQRQHVFRSDAAAKLDRLELVAALLERDATNNCALMAELGGALPARRASPKKRAGLRWRKLVDGCGTAVRMTVSMAVAIATSRQLRTAMRASYDFAVDFAIVLSTAAAAVVILAAAFMLTAPPV